MTPPPAAGEVVWDRFVRAFHWTLVACVVGNQWLVDDGDTLHQALGTVAVVLVMARVVWGFVGSAHARFASFFPTPRRVADHLGQLRAGRLPHHTGHNPLGALMMLTLMALVLALGATGWLQSLDAFWGNEALQELHEGLAKTLLLAAGVHAAAALLMGRLERTALVRAMFTGVKRPTR